MKIKSEMFREYDIRGVYEEDLNAEVALCRVLQEVESHLTAGMCFD